MFCLLLICYLIILLGVVLNSYFEFLNKSSLKTCIVSVLDVEIKIFKWKIIYNFNFPVHWEFQKSRQAILKHHKGDCKVLQSVYLKFEWSVKFWEEIISNSWRKEWWWGDHLSGRSVPSRITHVCWWEQSENMLGSN